MCLERGGLMSSVIAGRKKWLLVVFLLVVVVVGAPQYAYGKQQVSQEQNPLILQAFYWEMGTGSFAQRYPEEKALWNLLTERASEFADLGFTAMWLPPASKAMTVYDEGYAIYDPWDLGEFNQKGGVGTKYGTKEELKEAIDSLHAHDISVYYDAILNHRLGADRREKVPLAGGGYVDAWTDFSLGLQGRNKYYEGAHEWDWNWECFDGIDLPSGEALLFSGKSWDNSYDNDYLLGADVDYENQNVVDETIAWGKWLVDEMNFDGFRLDAIKHVDTPFTKKWIDEVQASTNKELFIVGEVWYSSVMSLQFYLTMLNNQDFKLFDFPLRSQFELLRDGQLNMANFGEAGLVNKIPSRAVTFVDNHDTFRDGLNTAPIFNRKCQAYTYILTREDGWPVVFWRDLYNANMQSELEKIIKARKLFAYGAGHEGPADSETYTYIREGLENRDDTGLVMMITSGKSGETIAKEINSRHPNRVYYDYTGNVSGEVKTDSEGYGVFKVKNVADQGWSIWVPK